MLRAIEVAEYFLWRACQEESELISHLKLQKLLYYAQGYCLARLERPLFDAPIEAWDHGPVVADIYRQYKAYGKKALPCPQRFRESIYRDEERAIIDEVYTIYGSFSAWTLRNMTHEEPLWQQTPTGTVIGIAQLQAYFATKVQYPPAIVQTEASSWDGKSDLLMKKLPSVAQQHHLTDEELSQASVEELAAAPEDSFQEVLDYVLHKNRELYKRLAA